MLYIFCQLYKDRLSFLFVEINTRFKDPCSETVGLILQVLLGQNSELLSIQVLSELQQRAKSSYPLVWVEEIKTCQMQSQGSVKGKESQSGIPLASYPTVPRLWRAIYKNGVGRVQISV